MTHPYDKTFVCTYYKISNCRECGKEIPALFKFCGIDCVRNYEAKFREKGWKIKGAWYET